jgi:CIC family chloride channel protein
MRRDFETIPLRFGMKDILAKFESTDQSDFLVVDSDNLLVGMIGYQEIRNLMTKTEMSALVIASDIMRPVPHRLYPDDRLTEAWDLFRPDEVAAVPVVARDNKRRILGIVTRHKITAFYNRRLVDDLQPIGPPLSPGA